jgi:uncharacterized protein DUF4314
LITFDTGRNAPVGERTVKSKRPPADKEYVDARGASLLAARIRAGVRVGARIELVTVADAASGLEVGDCGVVRSFVEDGSVLVHWDRGFALPIDPKVWRYRRLSFL